MPDHELYMKRCLDLAALGAGRVSPNPMVGCVIVHNDRIIGEGWHKEYGQAHAEVNAVTAVKDKSLLPGSTIYVSLEPCNFHGNTPPCTDLILKHQIPRVVIASMDNHPRVAGTGAARLKETGVEVISGICEKEAKHLNRAFFHFHETGKPYVRLKWAESANGMIAPLNGRMQLSNELTARLNHKWRSISDAILVGRRTIEIDDPSLTNRLWPGNSPVRVIVDPGLKLGSNFKVFSDGRKSIVLNTKKSGVEGSTEYIRLKNEGTDEILATLAERKFTSIMIEGGADTLNRFIKEDNWNEAMIFHSPVILREGIRAPELQNFSNLDEFMLGDNRVSIISRQ